ncbi:MAG: HlyC/CorC family transporter, partial [Planctomycetales bacterium]|nr:HlyC/CorC family transporter [Planctomycetales bacterium]
GLVTIEDVLEEIVGEIVDEHDESVEEEINVIGEGVCEALGKTHVDEINDRMAIELPDDGDFDTIGGFVFSELGRIPANGESLEWQSRVRITVLEVARRRIERVRVEVLDAPEQELV